MIKRQFPLTRLRRLRRTESIRSVISETNLLISDLIWPLFVIEGKNQKQPINSMPGVERYSIDQILQKCKIASLYGISMVALFPKLEEEKKAVKDYGSTDSGASLGDILGAALEAKSEKKDKKATNTKKD